MLICRVVGNLVATQKNRKLENPTGATFLAIDSVSAGIGEKVLVVIEGKAAGQALGQKAAAVDAAIIGIIDAVELVP